MPQAPQTEIWDRKLASTTIEKVPAGALLKWLYSPLPYKGLGWLLHGQSLASKMLGFMARTRFSRQRIGKFAEKYQIDLAECGQPIGQYPSFNHFFIRRLQPETRPWDPDPQKMASPADCRALFFNAMEKNFRCRIKGVEFNLAELLGADDEHCRQLAGGSIMIARLAPVDCHRFFFPADGRRLAWRSLPGRYDSVHPFALRRRPAILARNSRCASILELPHFGRAAMVEVGAFAVADIVQAHKPREFAKMQEKGFFNLGGSTIVLIVQPGKVAWDADLLEHSARGTEVRLRYGETVGQATRPKQQDAAPAAGSTADSACHCQ